MKQLSIAIILLFSVFSFSQDTRFGKVSEAELQEPKHPINPEAHAAVLYKSQNIIYKYNIEKGFRQVNTIHERIKIYDKQGFEWATKEIRLYDRSSTKSEELIDLDAFTYNLVNGKVEKTKIKKEGIFEEKKNKYWATIKFAMPDVREGSIIEFKYEIESPYIQIDDVVLQYKIPINQLEVDIKIPEFFYFNRILNPKAKYYPDLKDSKVLRIEKLRYKSKTRNGLGVPTGYQTDTEDWKFNENRTQVVESNIPALKSEPYVGNLDNYRSKLVWEHTMTKDHNGQISTYSNSWEDVSKTIYESESFGGQLKRDNFYQDDLDAILKNTDSEPEKAALIYNLVKSRVKWNGYLSYTSYDGIRKAYKDGTGNIGDINLLLVSMLKYAGLNANPILVSTRDNGIPIIPNLTGFNYVIAAIEIQNGVIFLDASQPYLMPNVLPEYAMNWQGRIIREDGSSAWVSLTPQVNSKELVSLSAKINTDFSVNGKVKKLLTDHLALEFMEKYGNINKEDYMRLLENGNGAVEISNLDIKNKTDLNQPINFEYEYNLDDAVEMIADKLYFSPQFFLTPKENPFKEDTRNYPIDFVYPISDKYILNIMLPEGYTVETMPESTKFEFNGTEGAFTYIGRQNGTMLQFTISLDLNKTLILSEEYEQFKKFYQLMIEKQTEKVVLKKV